VNFCSCSCIGSVEFDYFEGICYCFVGFKFKEGFNKIIYIV
jgi:hypothetical protein